MLKSKNLSFLLVLSSLLFFLLVRAIPVQAQDEGARIVSVKGTAEILKAGKWTKAKTGLVMTPGESIKLARGGEVRLSAADGKIEVAVKNGANISYEGEVDAKSVPWGGGSIKPISNIKPAASGMLPQFNLSVGEAEFRVTPGQPARVVAPLISAAVRGTVFVVTVAVDGSSAVSTLEGAVEAIGRNGIGQIIGPGAGFQLTSSQYTSFLQQNGFNIPSGSNWQSVDIQSLKSIDTRTLTSQANISGAQGSQVTSTDSMTAGHTTSGAIGSTATSTAMTTLSQVAPTLGVAATMGAAGVVAQSHAKKDEKPLFSGSGISGDIAILDTAGIPTNAFVTDNNGEIPFMVAIAAGSNQKTVTVVINGVSQEIPLDLTGALNDGLFLKITWAPGTSNPGISTAYDGLAGPNFVGAGSITDPTPGYNSATSGSFTFQSEAAITVMNRVNGVEQALTPAPSTVVWNVVSSSVNGSKLPWQRAPGHKSGLAWTAPGGLATTYGITWGADSVVTVSSPTNNITAFLTDVVGSRSVTVQAVVDGVTVEETFSFGDGPLSGFSGYNSSGIWSSADTDGPFQSSTFSAAMTCGGSGNNSVTVPGSDGPASSSSAGFTPVGSGWDAPQIPFGLTSPGNAARYATSSRLPKSSDLLAVANYNVTFNPLTLRKGAAEAADWTGGNYWTGEVTFSGSTFDGSQVSSIVGGVNWSSVTSTHFVICRRF